MLSKRQKYRLRITHNERLTPHPLNNPAHSLAARFWMQRTRSVVAGTLQLLE